MSDADGFQLRKYLSQHRAQPRYALEWILLAQRGTAAENNSLTVGRRPEIHDHPPRIDDVSAVGNERANPLDSQALRGDLVTADGDDPTPMPRRKGARVSIRRKQHVARLNHAASSRYFETVGGCSDGVDRAVIHYRGAALESAPQEGEQQTHGVERCIVVVHDAAVIKITGDLAPLFLSPQHADPLFESSRLVVRVSDHCRKMPRRMRAVKTSGLAPIAIHIFLLSQGAQTRHGLQTLLADSPRQVRAVARLQLVIRRLDAVGDLSAVAARTAGAEPPTNPTPASSAPPRRSRGPRRDRCIPLRRSGSRHAPAAVVRRAPVTPHSPSTAASRRSPAYDSPLKPRQDADQVPQNVRSTRSCGCGGLAYASKGF